MIKEFVIAMIIGIGAIGSLSFFGLPLAILYLIVCLDKIIAGFTRGGLANLGIEFTTIPVIFAGILYGPYVAFIFGFIVVQAVDVIRWIINAPLEASWFPVIPGPESLVDGIIGVVAALLAGMMGFFLVAVICILAKNILVPAKDMLVYGMPPRPIFLFNVVLNIVLANLLQFILFL